MLDLVKGNVKKTTEEVSDVDKEKFRDLELVAMTLMVEGIKDNLVPFISKIDHGQEMYESLLKLFTIKNIVQVASLKNESRNTKMTKEYNVATFFVKVDRLRDDLLATKEIIPDK